MKRYLIPLAAIFLLSTSYVFAAPLSNIYRSLIPEATDKYYVGTSTPSLNEWNGAYIKDLTISGTCTGCGGGSGGSGNVSTSSAEVAGQLPYWTSNSATPATLGTVATSAPSIGSVLTYSGTLGSFVGGSAGTFGIANSSITNAMLQNSTISGVALGSSLATLTATNGSLTFSGNYDGSAARTIGLNLANPNTFSALQQFGANASTTQFSATVAYFGGTATSTFTAAGFLGVGTTTPWAQLSLNPNGIGLGPAFAIGSSTKNLFIVTNTGSVGIGTTSPWRTFSVNGSSDLGTSALAGFFTATSTTASTFGGPITVTGQASLNGQASTTNISANFAQFGGTATTTITTGGAVGIGTTTPSAALEIASSTGTQLSLSDGTATNSKWSFQNKFGQLLIGTTSPTTYATSTPTVLTLDGSQASSTVSVATTTFSGVLNLGSFLTSGTSSVFTNKIQIDGYNAANARVCLFVSAANALVIASGACTGI